MSDHTLIPPTQYPGGSEAEFNALKRERDQFKNACEKVFVLLGAMGANADITSPVRPAWELLRGTLFPK